MGGAGFFRGLHAAASWGLFPGPWWGSQHWEEYPGLPAYSRKSPRGAWPENTLMFLLNFPIEIRLRIYSKLLVQDTPIEFGTDFGPCDPHLIRHGRQGLNPALLRVNKMVNREAIPFLYLYNHFRFPNAYTSPNTATGSTSEVPYIAPFLGQIGANARLLRHISINFPISFAPENWTMPVLTEEDSQVLQLLQETCPGLRTVEISSMPPDSVFSLCNLDLAEEMLSIR